MCPPALRVAVLAALLPGCALLPPYADAPAPVVRGPLPLRTNTPLLGSFLSLRPRSTSTPGPGRAELTVVSSYASIFENGSDGADRVTFDGELWRNSALFRHGIGENADIEFEIALLWGTSGFLDAFVEAAHDLLNLPDGGREERERFGWEMRAVADGQEIYELENDRLGLTDLPLALTARMFDEGAWTPALALRLAIELPTGSESRGFGNGGIDTAAGLLAEKSLGRWTLTASAHGVSLSRPTSFVGSGTETAERVDAAAGLEYRWDDATSVLAGLRFASPVTRALRLEEIGGDVLELDLAIASDLSPDSRVFLGFSEDLISRSGPDFTAFLGWQVGF